MDKNPVKIIKDIIGEKRYDIITDYYNDRKIGAISLDEAFESMKIFGKQCYCAGVLAEIHHVDGETIPDTDKYINKLEHK